MSILRINFFYILFCWRCLSSCFIPIRILKLLNECSFTSSMQSFIAKAYSTKVDKRNEASFPCCFSLRWKEGKIEEIQSNCENKRGWDKAIEKNRKRLEQNGSLDDRLLLNNQWRNYWSKNWKNILEKTVWSWQEKEPKETKGSLDRQESIKEVRLKERYSTKKKKDASSIQWRLRMTKKMYC